MNDSSEIQIKNVSDLYDKLAPTYDKLNIDSLYTGERILVEMYQKYNIENGKIFDIGCGTGKIKEALGNNFKYEGVDISLVMIMEAEKRGYVGHIGSIEEVIKQIPDKSVDHIIASSSLYFIKDFEILVEEFERIARRSLFITLEQFSHKVLEAMRGNNISIYNHDSSIISDPTEIQKNIFLWKRVSTGDEIYGDVVFKMFE